MAVMWVAVMALAMVALKELLVAAWRVMSMDDVVADMKVVVTVAFEVVK